MVFPLLRSRDLSAHLGLLAGHEGNSEAHVELSSAAAVAAAQAHAHAQYGHVDMGGVDLVNPAMMGAAGDEDDETEGIMAQVRCTEGEGRK